MEGLPPAMVVATEADVMSHGHVMYGLVKPAKVKKAIVGVESTAAMVNVIPRKRMYRMETPDELEIFKSELLKRPLVLQPEVKVIQLGWRERICNCVIHTAEENWIFMINQTHPKILGRIQMGVDAAKKVMQRGEPFVLEYTFSDALKRLYHDAIMKTPQHKGLREADCSYGDLIVRYPGDENHQGMVWSMKACHIRFAFEDLEPTDILVRTAQSASMERSTPVIEAFPEETLKQFLPGWKFQEISNEETDNLRYDYDQADQMYRSYDNEASSRPDVASQDALKPARVRGRSNRTTGNKYEVPVELHAPGNDTDDSNSRFDSRNGIEKVDHEYDHAQSIAQRNTDKHNYDRLDHRQGNGYHRTGAADNLHQHRHQGSITDSGFDDQDSNGSYKHQRASYQTQPDRNDLGYRKPKAPYDNHGFEDDHRADDILQKHKELAAKMLRQNRANDQYNGYEKTDAYDGYDNGQELETKVRSGRYKENRDYDEASYEVNSSDRYRLDRISSEEIEGVSESFI